MALRLALFDIDGTLIGGRDEVQYAALSEAIAAGFNLPGASTDDVPHAGLTDRATLLSLAHLYGLSDSLARRRVVKVMALKDAHLAQTLGADASRLLPNLQAHEVVVIGDTPLDVSSGQAIGAYTLAVTTGRCDKSAFIASAPDAILASLSPMPNLLARLIDHAPENARLDA